MKKNILYGLIALACLAACGDDDEVAPAGTNPGEAEPVAEDTLLVGSIAPYDTICWPREGGCDTIPCRVAEWNAVEVVLRTYLEDIALDENDSVCHKERIVSDTLVSLPDASGRCWLQIARSGSDIVLSAGPNDDLPRMFRLYIASGGKRDCIEGRQATGLEGVSGDMIGLSSTTADLDAAGDEVELSTISETYWITGATLAGTYVPCLPVWNKDSYSFVELDWLKVERDGRRLVISTDPNLTDEPRSYCLQLQVGSYCATVSGTQAIFE